MSRGKLFIFSAPSGSGKTTIIKELLKENLNLRFSISATSRKPRHTEKDSVDYYFLDKTEFEKRISENAFLEWEEVYQDVYYGTLKSEVERIIESGHNVIFDVDVVGGVNIKNFYKNEALAIFIQPPSVEALKQRLISRDTDSMEEIEKRIAKAEYELTFAEKFDKIIINDKLEDAISETKNIVKEFINSK